LERNGSCNVPQEDGTAAACREEMNSAQHGAN